MRQPIGALLNLRGAFVVTSVMGKWVHRLSYINEETETGVCSNCGPVSLRIKREAGRATWRCRASKKRYATNQWKYKNPYNKHKKDHCENPDCTATIEDPCQLDVDHVDGDNTNNDPTNLMTLCANCHRLKTKLVGDWKSRSERMLD